jgi:hypothetical protein
MAKLNYILKSKVQKPTKDKIRLELLFTANSLTRNIAKYAMEKADENNLASY